MSRRRHRHRGPGAAATTLFAVECPGCRAHVAVPRTLAGHVAACPACRATFLVPQPEPEEPRLSDAFDRPRRKRRTPRSSDPVAEPLAGGSASPPAPSPPHRAEQPEFVEPPPPRSRGRHDTPPAVAGAAARVSAPVHAADPVATVGPGAEHRPPHAETASAALAFREPVKTIRDGDTDIELRQLTPEERRSRRARRNLLLLVVGAALLVALAVLLGRGGR